MPILIDDVINSIEVELESACKTRDKAVAEIKYILKAANDNGRPNLTRDEDERVQELFAARDRAKNNIAGIESKLENARKAKAEELEQAERQREEHDSGVPRPVHDRQKASLQVGRNERTYRPDTDKRGTGFLRDVARQFLYNDPEAAFRLSQHMAEERVERSQYLERTPSAAGTGNFAGLVVPQYLTDMYAPIARAMRPFADICNHHDLPSEGMTVNIPLLSTGTAVGPQTSGENTEGPSTAPNDTLLTENVQTATGNVQLSRQAIDRGTGIDEVTMQDLFKAYATKLDNNLITQATTGLSAIAGTFAGTLTTTLTLANFYPKILGATAGVEAALMGLALPTHTIMHSSRWYWLASQLTNTWPAINTQGAIPPRDIGQLDPNNGYNQGVRGVLPSGLLVIVDNNIATGPDEVYVVARDECHLWEDPNPPVFLRAEQPAAAQLGVLMVVYGYYAYSFRRYSGAVQKVSGSAMTAPTW